MNLNGTQTIAIIIAVLSVLSGATAQLTDLFGAIIAKDLVSGAGLVTAVLSSVLAVITSQGSQVKSVLAMPGVDSIKVNAQANSTLAQIAVSTDPALAKIEPVANAETKVAAIAKGAA